MSDEVYVRRVRTPNPILQQLARQVVDELPPAARVAPWNLGAIATASAAAGVPFAYVLDELERRVREASS